MGSLETYVVIGITFYIFNHLFFGAILTKIWTTRGMRKELSESILSGDEVGGSFKKGLDASKKPVAAIFQIATWPLALFGAVLALAVAFFGPLER